MRADDDGYVALPLMVERLRRSNIDSAVAARHSNPNVRGSDGPPDPLLPGEGDDWNFKMERCREFRRMLPPDYGDIDVQTFLVSLLRGIVKER